MAAVHITSSDPEFTGSHFGLPPSSTHKITGLGGKMVWTMTYAHMPHSWLSLTVYLKNRTKFCPGVPHHQCVPPSQARDCSFGVHCVYIVPLILSTLWMVRASPHPYPCLVLIKFPPLSIYPLHAAPNTLCASLSSRALQRRSVRAVRAPDAPGVSSHFARMFDKLSSAYTVRQSTHPLCAFCRAKHPRIVTIVLHYLFLMHIGKAAKATLDIKTVTQLYTTFAEVATSSSIGRRVAASAGDLPLMHLHA